MENVPLKLSKIVSTSYAVTTKLSDTAVGKEGGDILQGHFDPMLGANFCKE